MAATSNSALATAAVPTIDIAPFLKDPDSQAAQDVVEAVGRACERTGFFQMVGHGVPANIQRRALDAAARVFALPMEEKRLLDTKKMPGHRGYDLLASQSYTSDSLPDLKESYYVAHDISADDERVKNNRFFMGPNVYPPFERVPRSELKEPAEAYHAALMKLTETIMTILRRSLNVGHDVFDRFMSNDPVAPMRMIHYPPQTNKDAKQFGASAHTDFGATTLLLQDTIAGLQVLDPVTEKWLEVPPQEGAFVFNVGDMLSMWTSNRYKSSWHRVLNYGVNDRYSIAFSSMGTWTVRWTRWMALNQPLVQA